MEPAPPRAPAPGPDSQPAPAQYDPWRRCDLERLTPAERAIYLAVLAVEAAGADLRLSSAVVALQAARAHVADFVDGVDRTPERFRKPVVTP